MSAYDNCPLLFKIGLDLQLNCQLLSVIIYIFLNYQKVHLVILYKDYR